MGKVHNFDVAVQLTLIQTTIIRVQAPNAELAGEEAKRICSGADDIEWSEPTGTMFSVEASGFSEQQPYDENIQN